MYTLLYLRSIQSTASQHKLEQLLQVFDSLHSTVSQWYTINCISAEIKTCVVNFQYLPNYNCVHSFNISAIAAQDITSIIMFRKNQSSTINSYSIVS